MVVSTPKTGNTWIKHLLSEAYSLPIVRLGPRFDRNAAAAAGPRWIAHQHLMPGHDLMDWGRENGVVFVTTIRHPGDVLVSLWHHVRGRCEADTIDAAWSVQILRDGPEGMGRHTREFVEQSFHIFLSLSMAWIHSGLALPVRYESLWDQPFETLRNLTDSILPVGDERIRLAACMCEIGAMQPILDPGKRFIRKGGVGSWREEIPEDIKGLLRSLDPYPGQFEALGYSMDAKDPANARRREPARATSPFGPSRTFENGAAVAPVIMRIYADLPDGTRRRWPDPRSVGPGTFHAWLNQPAAADAARGDGEPVVTELAFRIHRARPDIRALHPDVFGADRRGFNQWFLVSAAGEYALHRDFSLGNPFGPTGTFADGTPISTTIVRAYLDLPPSVKARWNDPTGVGDASFLEWLNAPAAADPWGGAIAPVITELGAYIHSIRADVAAAMPDLYGEHRVDYTAWFFSCGVVEHGLDRGFTLPAIRSWAGTDVSLKP
jgi:hypothetical protein